MDILIGIIAILVGLAFCFYGMPAMRIVISIWGAFVGFTLGATLVSHISGDGYLSTAVGWIVGIVLAFIFALFAYLYYVVAVVLAMASIGFALGTALMVALGVNWNWVIILAGVLVGVLLAWLALAFDLPSILLVVFSAFGGSTAIVGGLMLLFNRINVTDVGDGAVTARIDDSWWWWAIYAALVIAGIVVQTIAIGANRNLREDWNAPAKTAVG